MKECKSCGTEVAKSAKKCPKCGADQRNFFMKHKVLTIVGLILVIVVATQVTKGEEVPKMNLAIESVTYENPGEFNVDKADKIAIVKFKVKNVGYEEGVSVNPWYFTVETGEESDINYTVFGDYDMQVSNLKQGVEKEYSLAFPMTGDQKVEKLIYNPLLGDVFEAQVN